MKNWRVCLFFLSLMGMAGCDLGHVVEISNQSCEIEGQDSYILMADGTIIQRDNPEYADIFAHNICPKHAPHCLQDGDIHYCSSGANVGTICQGKQVDIQTDRDNCGGCDIVCSRDKICSGGQCVGCTDTADCAISAGWSEGACENGVCKASACRVGYYHKDIACFLNDNANCGKLSEACAPGTNCVDGACVGCTTTNDCAVSAGWAEGACDDGVCKASACKTGYYIAGDSTCNANDNANCGELGLACAAGTNCVVVSETDVAECVGCSGVEDCNARVMGWSEGTCDAGGCRASACKTGYYVDGSQTCRANDNANCGALGEACAAGTNCVAGECKGCEKDADCAARVTGWSAGKCDAGVCKASACSTGYYVDGSATCKASDNANCGALGEACAAGTNCIAGECKGCESDADCAARVTGWSAGKCDAGVCNASACTTGYYVDGSKTCKANDNANCGALGEACAAGTNCVAGQCKGCERDADCAARVTGWSAGSCDSGICKASACTTGYYVDGSKTCKANDNANCGALGNACAAGTNCSAGECKGCEKDADCAARVTGWAAGSCTEGICRASACSTGYYVDGAQTCQASDNANCGALGNACAAGTNCIAGECKGCEKDADCAARVTGWAAGSCTEGICRASACSTGYYVDGSLTCKANDNHNCGELGRACAAGTNCSAGECKGCEKDADCAARVTGWAAGSCTEGICKASACTTGYYVDGANTCKANDNYNCGELGRACAAGTNCNAGECKGCEKDADCAARVTGWLKGTCDAGVCKASACSTGYYVDGSRTCKANDNANCGKQGEGCVSGTNCIAGQCVGCTNDADCAARVTGWSKGKCEDGVCNASACVTGYYVDGDKTCKANDNANCGKQGEMCASGTNCIAGQCVGCTSEADCAARVTGWSKGICDSGVCSASACVTGYYVDGAGTCKANDNNNCGQFNKMCAAGTNCIAGKCVGCTSDNDCAARVTGWAKGRCNGYGACEATMCTVGYYVSSDKTCTANDNNNCGELNHKCPAGTNCIAGTCVGCMSKDDCAARVTGWSNGSCVEGVCQATRCVTGYYIDGDYTCKANDNNNCGELGKSCEAGTNCIAGKCVGCTDDNDCKALLPGWNIGSCSNGICKAFGCATGYYVDNYTCKANDNANCGKLGNACQIGTNCIAGRCVGCTSDEECAVRMTGWEDGYCSVGICRAYKCAIGYYLDSDSTCKANNNENCGWRGNACEPGTSCINGKCQDICMSGLTNCGGYCANLQSDNNHCGGCNNICNAAQYENSSTVFCVAGTCKVFGCNQGYVPNSDFSACIKREIQCNFTSECGPAPSNSTIACEEAKCVWRCSSFYADANGDRSDGCEQRVGYQAANCGSAAVDCGEGSCTQTDTDYVCKCSYYPVVVCSLGQTCLKEGSTYTCVDPS